MLDILIFATVFAGWWILQGRVLPRLGGRPDWVPPVITDTCGMGLLLARMPWN